MSRVHWVLCCAFLSIAAVLFPTIVAAQDPFGPAEAENPFAPQAQPAELQPEPALAPAAAVDPSPGGEVALPAVVDAPAGAPHDFCRCVGEGSQSPSVARIRAALRSPLRDNGLEMEDLALQKAIAIMQDEYDVPIRLDTAALDDLGVQPDQPITVNLHGISLRSALRLILKELGLTYIIEDEVLLITTPDEAEKKLKTCVYDVRSLTEKATTPRLGSGAWDYDPLIDAITKCVAKETWAENGGGEAAIQVPGPGFLVVSQTDDVHEQIRELLATLREFRREQVAGPVQAAAPIPGGPIAVPPVDDAKVVTHSYYLQINQQPGESESFAPKVRQLITLSLPDEQWAGRLDNGEPVVLTVLPDRVVLRHRQSVQNKVQSLLADSGLSTPPTSVANEQGGGGGFGGGGGGGGFYNPRPAEHQ